VVRRPPDSAILSGTQNPLIARFPSPRACGAGAHAGSRSARVVVSAQIFSPTKTPLDERRARPERSLDQRIDALTRANEVRTLRAELKRDLKGRQGVDRCAAARPAPYLETAKVFDLLLALPKHGRVKATKILHSCRISPSKTFGGLSERQRAELGGHLNR
jgi:hypothetical protein